MNTLLEQQRAYHEEKERIMDAMTKEMFHSPKSHIGKINSDHRMRQLLDRYMEDSANLRDLYEDKDGQRKEEVAALSDPNEFAEFYSRLKSIQDFHTKHPNEVSIPMSEEFNEVAQVRENPSEDIQNMVEFSDEEGYGRYLDLHECFDKYLQLKGIENLDYITYLTIFDQLFNIPKERKNASYRSYLLHLLGYLDDYVGRIKPLLDMKLEEAKVKTDFEKQWAEGSFRGWPKETSGALTHAGAYLDLSAFSSRDELMPLGLDRLKSALMALGLKCGGTLEERAARLFWAKGKSQDELGQSLFAKTKPGKTGKSKDSERQSEIAMLEAQVYCLAEILSEQRSATRENVTRKQARTGEEREESDEEHGMSDDDSDDEDGYIPYNPKNLPLGWDGKPIPYWLYKLHGLNISYHCEICGNYRYRGPKEFQRHFAEWRHAHGMRCLGIPNTAHFANVTLVEDAIALWQKIKTNKETNRWKADMEEEYEDSSGNVVNKKTFEDLKRQGLL